MVDHTSPVTSYQLPIIRMSRSRVYGTEAIILRRTDYGEADRLLTLMTPNLGKLRVIAKGARKITSRKAGHIEMFTRVQLLLARGRTFDIVSQAETIEAHRQLREDLLRGGYAHYLGELTDQFTQEGSEDPALYDLLANGMIQKRRSHTYGGCPALRKAD